MDASFGVAATVGQLGSGDLQARLTLSRTTAQSITEKEHASILTGSLLGVDQHRSQLLSGLKQGWIIEARAYFIVLEMLQAANPESIMSLRQLWEPALAEMGRAAMTDAVRCVQRRFAIDQYSRHEDSEGALAAFESCLTYQTFDTALAMGERVGQAPSKKLKTGGKADDKKDDKKDDKTGHYGYASGRK